MREYKEPQSYAEMFQMAMRELKKQTDIYFEFKKKEFDEYATQKMNDSKCCKGGPHWGHAWSCKNQPD